jgi:hypothetical protein
MMGAAQLVWVIPVARVQLRPNSPRPCAMAAAKLLWGRIGAGVLAGLQNRTARAKSLVRHAARAPNAPGRPGGLPNYSLRTVPRCVVTTLESPEGSRTTRLRTKGACEPNRGSARLQVASSGAKLPESLRKPSPPIDLHRTAEPMRSSAAGGRRRQER